MYLKVEEYVRKDEGETTRNASLRNLRNILDVFFTSSFFLFHLLSFFLIKELLQFPRGIYILNKLYETQCIM